MTTNKISIISSLFVVWITLLTIEVITNNNIIDTSYLIFVIVCFIEYISIKIQEWQTFFFSL